MPDDDLDAFMALLDDVAELRQLPVPKPARSIIPKLTIVNPRPIDETLRTEGTLPNAGQPFRRASSLRAA